MGSKLWCCKTITLLKSDNIWESFSFPLKPPKYPLKLAVDFYGSVWMALDPLQGGGILVFNKDENSTVSYRGAGLGGLPDKSVDAITIDRDGIVWVGTDQGVAYFIDPTDVFWQCRCHQTIFDGRFLLKR